MAGETSGEFAPRRVVEPPDATVELAPIAGPRPAVGLGAICDLRASCGDEPVKSFTVGEYVLLDDGRRVMVHRERGFTMTLSQKGASSDHSSTTESADSLVQLVLSTVLPDDDDCPDDHPWSWLAELARQRGLSVTEEHLRQLPYEVVLTDAVHAWLAESTD